MYSLHNFVLSFLIFIAYTVHLQVFQIVTNLQRSFPVFLFKSICIKVNPTSSNPCCSRGNCSYLWWEPGVEMGMKTYSFLYVCVFFSLILWCVRLWSWGSSSLWSALVMGERRLLCRQVGFLSVWDFPTVLPI